MVWAVPFQGHKDEIITTVMIKVIAIIYLVTFYVRHFMHIISFNPHNNPRCGCYRSHIVDEGTKALRTSGSPKVI